MLANSAVLKRSFLALIIVLVVGLALAVAIARPAAVTGSEGSVTEHQDSPAVAAARGADFEFLDHEMRYAGGYELRSVSAAPRGADFDFLDHELRYAGGYGLVPVAPCGSP